MPTQVLKPAISIFCLVLATWVFYRLVKGSRQKRKDMFADLKKELLIVLLTLYICAVMVGTIAPASISGFNNQPEPGLNIIPVINTYKQFISTLGRPDNISKDFALENIIGNIILFLPLGIFLPLISPKFNSIKKVAIVCFIASLGIELTQLVLRQFGTYRTVDIDDIILNMMGGISGWLILKLIARFLIKN